MDNGQENQFLKWTSLFLFIIDFLLSHSHSHMHKMRREILKLSPKNISLFLSFRWQSCNFSFRNKKIYKEKRFELKKPKLRNVLWNSRWCSCSFIKVLCVCVIQLFAKAFSLSEQEEENNFGHKNYNFFCQRRWSTSRSWAKSSRVSRFQFNSCLFLIAIFTTSSSPAFNLQNLHFNNSLWNYKRRNCKANKCSNSFLACKERVKKSLNCNEF